MPIDLAGKPIAITGASSGIGQATALACAEAGMPVALAARRADRLEDAKRRIESAGGRATTFTLDVTDADASARLIDHTVEHFGSVYSVYANAGFGFERPHHETSREDLRAIFETNLWGSLNVIDPALPRMIDAGAGHVIICASCLSKIGIPYYGPYCATKAAQDYLGRAMRHELAPKGVHVSTVHPIGTRTEFFDEAKARSGGSSLMDRTPNAAMQSPERVASAIVKCLRKPKGEVWTSTPTRLALGLAVAMPGLTDFALRKMVAKRRAD